jgi:DNA polymerase-3 subunit beta
MCIAQVEIDQATDQAAVVVPRRAVDVLCRLAHAGEVVQLEATGSELVATVDGTAVRARLVEGRFPKWQDVEPKRDTHASQVVVGELLATCRQAAICTSEQSKGVVFTFAREGLHLTSRSAEAGEASCTCDLVESGHACTVSLDPAFVTEWLGCGSFDLQETIEIEAADAQSAVVLRAQDCRCVIMPLDPKG